MYHLFVTEISKNSFKIGSMPSLLTVFLSLPINKLSYLDIFKTSIGLLHINQFFTKSFGFLFGFVLSFVILKFDVVNRTSTFYFSFFVQFFVQRGLQMLRAVQMGLHSLLSCHLNMTSLAKEFLVIREFRSLASSSHFFSRFL